MRTQFGLWLALYGCLLASLAWVGIESDADAVSVTLLVGGVAGLLCVGWGLSLAAGRHGKAGALLTLAVLALTLMVEAVQGWMGDTAAHARGVLAPVLTTTLLLITVALLLRLVHGRTTTSGLRPRPGHGKQADLPKPAPQLNDQTSHT